MKAFILPRIEDELERQIVEGCLKHFERGEVIGRMLELTNTISDETIDRVCRANLMPELPF